MVDTPFHITDTHLDDERGPVLEGLTKNQAGTLKKYLVKMQAKIDQLKREAHPITGTPEDGEKMSPEEVAQKYGVKK